MDPAGRREREAVALVLGTDVTGSAVAHALHVAGWDVVLIDDIDPPTPQRGMSFANAWYLGSAELASVAACFCSSVRSIPSVLQRRNLIAATSWSWQGVAGALVPELLVDTRAADGGQRETLLARASGGLLTVGCGPGYVAGVDVAIAVETSVARAGQATSIGAVPVEAGAPAMLGGAGAERFIVAPRAGRMRTQRRIGEAVRARDPIGDVNGMALVAPIEGVLRGLSARGARVGGGRVVAEIDPRGDPALCYGLDGRAARIAAGVVAAVDEAEAAATRIEPVATPVRLERRR